MPAKIRRDAKLKSLPLDRQQAVFAILETTGITKISLGRVQRECKVDVRSLATLADFYHWYGSPQQRMQRELASAGSVTELVVQRMRKDEPAASPEKLFEFGQAFFAQLALAQQDPKGWLMTQTAYRDRERVALKGEEVQIMRTKFRRETLELFLDWYERQEAKAIAGSEATHAEKIERLGQLMFGEGWR